MQGTIKNLPPNKPFGFIESPAAGKDVFFHQSVLEGIQLEQLEIGDTVEFEMEESEKGLQATKVSKA